MVPGTADAFTITHSGKQSVHVTMTGGPDTYTSDVTTAIANGSVAGQKLLIQLVTPGGNTIQIRDNANTKLSSVWVADTAEEWLLVEWDGSNWVEAGRGHNKNINSGLSAGSVAGSGNINSGDLAGSAGGGSNTNQGDRAGSVGGYGNENDGNYCGSAGGYYNDNTDSYASSVGGYALADKEGEFAHACGRFGTEDFSAQYVRFLLRGSTTDGTPTELTAPERWVLLDEKAYACTVTVVGRQDDGTDHCMYKRMILMERTGGTVAEVGEQTIGTDIEDEGGFDITLTADDTNKSLKVEVTGVAAHNMRWVALIEAVEIGYAD